MLCNNVLIRCNLRPVLAFENVRFAGIDAYDSLLVMKLSETTWHTHP